MVKFVLATPDSTRKYPSAILVQKKPAKLCSVLLWPTAQPTLPSHHLLSVSFFPTAYSSHCLLSLAHCLLHSTICRPASKTKPAMTLIRRHPLSDCCWYVRLSLIARVFAVPEGTVLGLCSRSTFYHLFMSVRPLPVPEMLECIQTTHQPKTRFVADALALRRKIEMTKQSVQKQTDPVIAQRMAESLEFMQESYDKKQEDVRIFEAFSLKNLKNQTLPSGLIYVCGEWFDIGQCHKSPLLNLQRECTRL